MRVHKKYVINFEFRCKLTNGVFINLAGKVHTKKHHILRIKFHSRVFQVKSFEEVHGSALNAPKERWFVEYLENSQ